MPNIELHGYGRLAQSMKFKVRAALSDLPGAKDGEIVTTIYRTASEDFRDNRMRFLRIIATLNDLPELLERLLPLNQDIEMMVLGQWIPKQPQK